MIMTEEFAVSLLNNNDALISFQKDLMDGSVNKLDIDEFIFYAAQFSKRKDIELISRQYDMATMWTSTTRISWWGCDNPEALPIPEAYFGSLIPTRLICACLLTIVFKDRSKLDHHLFSWLLPSVLNLCAIYGLKYMTETDLDMTIDAFKASKAWLFVDSNPDFCRAFTNFVNSNQEILGHVEVEV